MFLAPSRSDLSESLLSPEVPGPLAEPLPPNLLGAAGVEMAGLTTELATRFLEGEGGLERRRTVKQTQDNKKGQIALTCHYY